MNKGSVSLALTLIFIGMFFLLHNFGVLPWSIWMAYIYYWPILLIGFGFKILLPRNSSLRIVVGVLAVIVPIVLYINPFNSRLLPTPHRWPNIRYNYNYKLPPQFSYRVNRDVDMETYSDRVNWIREDGITKGKLELDFGAGELIIGGNQEKQVVFKYQDSYPQPRIDYKVDDGKVNIEVEAGTNSSPATVRGISNRWLLELDSKIPWELGLDVGACKGVLDLEEIPVEKIKLHTGAGDFSIRLGNLSSIVDLEIKTGVSNMVIDIPKAAVVRAKVQGGLTSKNNSFTGWERRGDYYYSPNYSQGGDVEVQLEVTMGVGNFRLNRY